MRPVRFALRIPFQLLLFLLTLFALIPQNTEASEPLPWQTGFQPPASPLAHQILQFHNQLIFPIISAITVFVIALLIYVCWRFSEKRNPKPSTRTNNEIIEVIWTIVPVIILVVMFIPSFKLIKEAEKTADAEMTVKIIGNQWYWSYEYPDQDNISFDSLLIPEEDLPKGGRRLMDTDNPLVLPVNTKVRVQITATNVLHSWSVPAFGVKMDAVPGRLNEIWVEVEKTGTYYGFCSELCGQSHTYMPIMVQIISKEEFLTWVDEAKKLFANNDKKLGQRVTLANSQKPIK